MENNYKIYALKLKDSEEIKYIGYTSRELCVRLYEHLNITINEKYKNSYWIKKHKNNIEIILIEDNIKTHKEICKKEINYIKLYRNLGHDLNNTTNGGDGMLATDEIRKKISDANKGKIISDETKLKISKTLKGRVLPIEVREKMSKFQKSKKVSKETKLKISNAHKGKLLSEKTKLKISKSKNGCIAWNKGKNMSDEQKIKLSKSHTGTIRYNSRKIEVFVYKTKEYVNTFNSINDCVIQLKLKSNHINEVLNGNRKHSYGYLFKEVK